jgi:Ca2+-binding RTX toxin-like protein
MPITATYAPATFTLTVTGTTLGDAMSIERDVAGALRINGGTVPIGGGSPTVANTSLIAASGSDGDDVIAIDETNGAMPAAELVGGSGNDTLTGGSAGDILTGEADNDILLGRGGIDQLYGGTGNDTLTGGDGSDQMFGEDGDDRMIWNPGDDNDLMEGGIGNDTAEVNGGNGAETFTITANGTRVQFDRLTPAPFTLDIGTTENLVLNANGGDDQISAVGNLSLLIALTIDGGAGNDTILGGNGADTIFGGDNDDFVDGNQGNDTVFLGNGNDIFNWDPGDGSDVVEGQAGTDTLNFNASAANELMDVSANGSRVRATRNVGAIIMDMNGLETLTVNLLGGTDGFTVNDLTGTELTTVNLNLAGTIGGSAGDAAADSIIVNGSAAANIVSIVGAGTSVSVTGLSAAVNITNAEGANDTLTVNGNGDNDTLIASSLPAGVIKLVLDGGTGHDVLLGSQGADTLLGGDGNDYVIGDNGNDTALLGNGDDVFEWNPGDGNDIIEGQANTDELRFNGSNASENISISANGGRLLFFRDVASVTMDMDDVEKIRITVLGGADTITVGDLTGTDATLIDVRLAGSGGVADGVADNVTVTGTNAADNIVVSAAGGVITASGLAATVSLTDAEAANDRLTVNASGGDDVIDASGLAAGLIQLTLNGGLGNDIFFGSAGSDLVIGGDGNDTALLGAGDDVFVWNPGDDNDIVEGQTGTDTLQFNGANIAETITISANGARTLFTRDVAAITMDLNDVEVIRFAALGGIDNITVNNLDGTDVTDLVFDLAGTLGGASGDGQADIVALNGSAAANTISLSGTGAALIVTGLPWTVTLNQIETADRLTILAGEGNDSISTAGIANQLVVLTLDGGGGNDVLRSTGDGTYLGGNGDDLIFAGLTTTSEILDGGAGNDTLDTTSFNSTYTVNLVTGLTNFAGESFVNFENLISGNGADTVTGTAGANIIRTNGGVDNVSAGNGDDVVEGGAGGDTLDGGIGTDTVDYSSSNAAVTVSLNTNSATGGHATGDFIVNFENVSGSAFADTLTGNGLANVINGGAGADSMTGLGGNDIYIVDNAADAMIEAAGQGYDVVYTSINFALAAGQEIEALVALDTTATTPLSLTGNGLANYLIGNAGANVLNGGTGADILDGRGGNDVYIVDNAGDVVVEAAGQGYDVVFAALNFTLAAGQEIEGLVALDVNATSALTLTGNELANYLIGNAGANQLNGGAGADILEARAGDDVMDGGAGADLMLGGQGNDIYFVDNGGDLISEAAGEGYDVAYVTTSYALAAGSEVEGLSTLDWNAITAINLTGNAIANYIIGNAGANILDGGAGADILQGRGGADTFAFTTALGATNVDLVLDFVGGADKLALDDALFAGIGTPGAFNANAFFAGSAAHDLDDRIIYNQATGQLFYDADGTGAIAAVLFATLQGNPAVGAGDFAVI